MAKITDLAAVDAITGDEFLPIVQRGATKRATMNGLRALIVPYLQNWYRGDPGDPGPAGNVCITLAQLRAAPRTNGTMIAAYDGSGSTMTWTQGDFAARAARRPQDYVQSTGVALTEGAWVRQGAQSVRYDAAQSVAAKLDRIAYITDARFAGGAKMDGETDDYAAIQAAIDYIDGIGGGEVRIPEGTANTLTTPLLKGKASLTGVGPASIIRAVGCNGLHIDKSDEIAPRRVGGFRLYGHGGERYTGISANIAFPDRVQGICFDNLFIDFFGTGIAGRGFWHTTFRTITMNHVHRALFFYDRNVVLNFDDCKAIHGGAIDGNGPSIGFQIGDDNPTFRPEEIWLRRCFFFGFDKGGVWRNALYGGLSKCGLDACGQTGLEIVTADGGTTFENGWIDVIGTTGDLRGIHCVPLGYNPPPINCAITNNRVNVPATSTAGAEAVGILVEANQANLRIEGNSLPNAASRSMRIEGQPNGRVKRVKVLSNETAGDAQFFNMDGGIVDHNSFGGGMAVSGNVGTSFGSNKGLHTTEIIASVDVPAGQTSVTVTWLSLNISDLPFGAEQIACVVSDRGNVTHGGLASIPTRTGITIYCEKPLGAPSTIDIHARLFS